MFNNIEAVIFDLDGSLVDSMWMWRDIDIEYLQRFHIALPEGLQGEIEGKSFSETAIYFKERFCIPDSIDKIKDDWNKMAWEKYTKDVPLKEGVYDFLCECKKRGLKLGIATSNSRELVENISTVHNLSTFFSCITTGCDVEKGKPSPDIYLKTARDLNVMPEHCLVFEDIIPGIVAGKEAGMYVCAVDDAYSEHIKKEKMELADYYIYNFNNLFGEYCECSSE